FLGTLRHGGSFLDRTPRFPRGRVEPPPQISARTGTKPSQTVGRTTAGMRLYRHLTLGGSEVIPVSGPTSTEKADESPEPVGPVRSHQSSTSVLWSRAICLASATGTLAVVFAVCAPLQK